MSDQHTARDHDGEISLRVYFETLWRYRQIVALAVACVCVLTAVTVLALRLLSPAERVASVQIRLLFDGAARDQYPNGAPFSPADIIGAPALTEVFKSNDLQRFGSYEHVRQTLAVQQASPELYNLTAEYQARLADYRITPVERVRLEEEFRNKRHALVDPVFMLSLRSSERLMALPASLIEKVLTDILATWAEQAEVRKGVLRYQVPVLSNKALTRDTAAAADYFVAVDVLRTGVERLVRTIDDMEKLPGALTLRAKADRLSLADIRAVLENAVRFDLDPLLGLIRAEGITRNGLQLSIYASTRAFQARHDKQESEERARALQAGLREYSAKPAPDKTAAGTPPPAAQPPTADLDRLEKRIAGILKDDAEFRQSLTTRLIEETRRAATFNRSVAYYEDIAARFRRLGARPNGSGDVLAEIKDRTTKAHDLIARSADQLAAFYEELSAQNLGPASRLYVVTRPFEQHTENALSMPVVWRYFWLVMLLTLLVVPGGCLVHDSIRQKTGTRLS